MSDIVTDVKGSCCCGKVTYHAAQAGSMIIECHCRQCQKQSEYRSAHVQTRTGHVVIKGEDNMTWFRPFPGGERGFCADCGSHMFWRSTVDDELTLLVATIDSPEAFKMGRHVYADEHAYYYDIDDGNAQYVDYDTPKG